MTNIQAAKCRITANSVMAGDGSATPTRSYYSSSASSTRYSTCSPSTRYSYNLNTNGNGNQQPNYYFYPGTHNYRRDGANYSDVDTDDSISEGSSSTFSELVFVIIKIS